MHTRGLPDGNHLTTQQGFFFFLLFFLRYPIDFQSTLGCALVAFGYIPQHTTQPAFEVAPTRRLAGRGWLIEVAPVTSSSVLSVTAVGSA